MSNLFLLNKIYCRTDKKYKNTMSPKKDLDNFFKKIGVNNNLSDVFKYDIKNTKIKDLQNIIKEKQNDILLLYNIIHNEYNLDIEDIQSDYGQQIKDFNLLINIFLQTIRLDS